MLRKNPAEAGSESLSMRRQVNVTARASSNAVSLYGLKLSHTSQDDEVRSDAETRRQCRIPLEWRARGFGPQAEMVLSHPGNGFAEAEGQRGRWLRPGYPTMNN